MNQLVLLSTDGQVVAKLARMANHPGECKRLVCAAVDACTERYDGALCTPPGAVHSDSQSINARGSRCG